MLSHKLRIDESHIVTEVRFDEQCSIDRWEKPMVDLANGPSQGGGELPAQMMSPSGMSSPRRPRRPGPPSSTRSRPLLLPGDRTPRLGTACRDSWQSISPCPAWSRRPGAVQQPFRGVARVLNAGPRARPRSHLGSASRIPYGRAKPDKRLHRGRDAGSSLGPIGFQTRLATRYISISHVRQERIAPVKHAESVPRPQ